ncbi:Ig-like domain-containing protein [Erysipelothrix sp. Poltava]|nr:Ig-like domain-containing protein [Erysipelothrix sp. Poltava]
MQEPIKAFKPVVIRTERSQKIELPKTVTAQYETLFDKDVAVTWDAFDVLRLDEYGTFEIKGRVEGTDIQVCG